MAKQMVETAACAELASLAVQHPKAAGIDVGDASHWVCIDADGGDDAVREFPAHTPGLRQLVAWLRQHGITTVAFAPQAAPAWPQGARSAFRRAYGPLLPGRHRLDGHRRH
jgi:hypothetical protein